MKSYQEDTLVQQRKWWILIACCDVHVYVYIRRQHREYCVADDIGKYVRTHDQAEWVVSVYLMVVCACLLLFGKIGDSWGKIKVFRLGMLIFTIGSLLCGFNHSLAFLLFARVVQAIGASMTMATNTGIITEVFPISERGRALGMIGAFVSLGSIAGPGLGGIILSHFSWPYTFLDQCSCRNSDYDCREKILPKDITMSRNSIDKSGFGLFSVAILTFFGGIFIGQEQGFLTWLPLVLIFVAIIAFIAFIQVEKRVAMPLITFSIFRNKIFTLSLFTALLIFSANFFC